MSTKDERRAKVERLYHAGFLQGNMSAVDDFAHEGYAHSLPQFGEGAAGLRAWIETLRSAVSDFEISVDDFVNDEDQSVTRWTARFRHTAELMGIPATGKSVEISGISWMRWQGDKVSQQWECAEEIRLLTAVGVLPEG